MSLDLLTKISIITIEEFHDILYKKYTEMCDQDREKEFLQRYHYTQLWKTFNDQGIDHEVVNYFFKRLSEDTDYFKLENVNYYFFVDMYIYYLALMLAIVEYYTDKLTAIEFIECPDKILNIGCYTDDYENEEW